jgi:hypothetical protein
MPDLLETLMIKIHNWTTQSINGSALNRADGVNCDGDLTGKVIGLAL